MQAIFFLTLALVRKRKKQTLVALFGVAIGFTAFVVMSSLMFGFQKYFIQQVIDLEPHLMIKPKEELDEKRIIKVIDPQALVKVLGAKPKEKDRILGWRDLVKKLESYPEVIGVTYQLQAKGVIKYGAKEKPVSLIGIEPAREAKASSIEKFLTLKRLDTLSRNPEALILGAIIARDLGIKEIGKKVLLTFPNGATKLMKVEDFFNSGITNIDNTRIYLPLKTLQSLLDRPNEVNLLALRIRDVNRAEELARKIGKEIRYEVESWQRAYLNFLKIFKVQNIITYMIVFAIILVSSFGIFNIIYMMVVDKRKEIAILLAMGYQPREIVLIFLFCGIVLWILGSILGIILAYLLESYLAQVEIGVEGLIRSKGFMLDRSVRNYLLGLLFTLIFTIGASFYPSYKASRLNPVEIFRSY